MAWAVAAAEEVEAAEEEAGEAGEAGEAVQEVALEAKGAGEEVRGEAGVVSGGAVATVEVRAAVAREASRAAMEPLVAMEASEAVAVASEAAQTADRSVALEVRPAAEVAVAVAQAEGAGRSTAASPRTERMSRCRGPSGNDAQTAARRLRPCRAGGGVHMEAT